MKKTMMIAALVIIAVLAMIILLTRPEPEPPQNNILLITLDTTRADRLGCYGYDTARTPALDKLAQRGTLFDNAFTPVPITLPAHTTLFTGLYPPEHGIRVNGKNSLSPHIPFLPEMLAKQGYQTAAFTASSVLSSIYGLNRGFTIYDDLTELQPHTHTAHFQAFDPDPQHTPYRMGNEVVDTALSWLQTHVQARARGFSKKPFFVWVHLYDPHLPGHWHREHFGTAFAHQYDAEIAFMDMQIGRLLDFVKENQLDKNTLIIAAGDHGEGLGANEENSHGFMLYSTLHVPMIFSLPGNIKTNNRVSSMISLVDFMPTVIDFLDIDPLDDIKRKDPRRKQLEQALQRSFASALTGGEIASRPCYAETDLTFHNFGWAPLRSYITPEQKYIRAPRPELYDRVSDPEETNNVATMQPEDVRRLEDLLAEIENSMISGSVPTVELSDEELRKLESLGYMGGGQETASDKPLSELIDIKDMIPVLDLQHEVRQRIQKGVFDAETLKLCREVVELSPDTAIFQGWLGTIYFEQGDWEQAMSRSEAALEIAPQGITIYNNLARIFYEKQQFDTAIKYLNEAHRIKPKDEKIKYNLAISHNHGGLLKGREKDLPRAVDHFLTAIEAHPNFAEAHHNLGIAYFGQGSAPEAIEHFEKALELKPDYLLAKRNLELARRLLRQASDNQEELPYLRHVQ